MEPYIMLPKAGKTRRAKMRQVAGHQVVGVSMLRPYRLYDRLVLRNDRHVRSIWTVLACDQSGEGWQVTGLRCPPGCEVHHRRR